MNEALENISMFLSNTGEKELACKVLDVFGKRAINFEHFDEVSRCFFKIKDYDKAIYFGEKAYAIASSSQQMYIIRANLTNVYNHNNMPEKALRYIKANESVMPDDNDRDFERAYSHFLMNDKNAAAKLLRSKVGNPTLTEEQRVKLDFNLGTYDMIDGNLQQGLKRFLWSGEKMKIWDHHTFFQQDNSIDSYGFTRWDGTIEQGQNILIIAEAGIGDEVINARFFVKLKELGMNPLWMTLTSRKDLAEIYNLNGITTISGVKEIPPEFTDFVAVPSMHIPIFLNSSYETLWNGPYLTNTFKEYDEKWKILTSLSGDRKKIGIRWQGNPAYDQDLHRSVPLKKMKEALEHIDADFFSIQKDTGIEQLTEWDDLIDLAPQSENLKDLFSYIKQMDIIVTSCTSIAHIAGAMGKEVYVWVPISCYYVWCNSTKQSPWYADNMHVLYQAKPRSWDNCVEEMKTLL
jgi:tetratricopeptide (TPR) repeat protein